VERDVHTASASQKKLSAKSFDARKTNTLCVIATPSSFHYKMRYHIIDRDLPILQCNVRALISNERVSGTIAKNRRPSLWRSRLVLKHCRHREGHWLIELFCVAIYLESRKRIIDMTKFRASARASHPLTGTLGAIADNQKSTAAFRLRSPQRLSQARLRRLR